MPNNSPDLTYSHDGIFAVFYPETPFGEIAWKAMAADDAGGAKVLALHAESVLRDLRAAGYVVRRAKPVGMTDDQLLLELAGA